MMVTGVEGKEKGENRTVFGIDGFQYGLKYAVNVHRRHFAGNSLIAER